MKLKKMLYVAVVALALSFLPATICPASAQAVTYEDVKSKVKDISGGAQRFWEDSAADRAILSKKAKKKWKKLQKKIKKEYKKAKKKGKKGLKKFKKWRKRQEKEFWQWYAKQTNS